VVAKNLGLLDRIRPSVDALLQAGLHADEAVVDQALRMADEL
jgi:predicted nucleic acid-binding protein